MSNLNNNNITSEFMSEYWKSTPKYWCKHCNTYVKDTPFEKKQHEITGKHQGNLKRFLNGIQKDHDRGEREKDKARAEVERLNRIVGSSSTVSAANAGTTASTSRTTSTSTPTRSVTDQQRQWAQLADMGIAIPDSARVQLAVPGEWQTITRVPKTLPLNSTDVELSTGVHKRRRESQDDAEETADRIRKKDWGSTKRVYPSEQPASDDVDALLAVPVNKTTKLATPDADVTLGVKVELESTSAFDGTSDGGSRASAVKLEPESDRLPPASDQHDSAGPPTQQTPVFKKRKAKIVLPS